MNPEAKAEVDHILRKSTEVLNFWMFFVRNQVYTQRAFNRVNLTMIIGSDTAGSYL